MVFSHNDLGSAKIFWNGDGETANKLSFIDLEMALNSFAVFEISDLFVYYLGYYPEEVQQAILPGQNLSAKLSAYQAERKDWQARLSALRQSISFRIDRHKEL